jgi:hypothetical protein
MVSASVRRLQAAFAFRRGLSQRKACALFSTSRSRKRVATSRPRPNAPCFANEVWAYDFVFDACANGQQVK